ncbi:MAG: hypothetical protein DME26_00265 [Verrucomicrobia bacterium]|nr:MAG: hypothetical protein DME26_00265 [Verrucomicrobiota bacterium]
MFGVLLLSSLIVIVGIGLGWRLYGRKPATRADEPDALEKMRPDVFAMLRNKFYVDELYDVSFVRLNACCARVSRWLDDVVWNGAVMTVSCAVIGLSWLNRLIDEFVVNLGFDKGCSSCCHAGKTDRCSVT